MLQFVYPCLPFYLFKHGLPCFTSFAIVYLSHFSPFCICYNLFVFYMSTWFTCLFLFYFFLVHFSKIRSLLHLPSLFVFYILLYCLPVVSFTLVLVILCLQIVFLISFYFQMFWLVFRWFPMVRWCRICVIEQYGKYHIFKNIHKYSQIFRRQPKYLWIVTNIYEYLA